MASFDAANAVVLSAVPNFVPQLWSDEVVASYKSNIVLANLVRVLNHNGKKGSSIKIPTPTRGSSSDKAAATQVTLITHGTDTGITISINKHKEYSRLIEDIVDVQALESLRRFYTDDAGYAIARAKDSDLFVEALSKTGATINYTVATNLLLTTSTFPTLYNGSGATWNEITAPLAITDAGIRTGVRLLDLQDAPSIGRHFVVHPYTKEDLLGLTRFSEQAFVGNGDTIRTGFVGDTYGMDVYVTNRCPTIQDSTAASVGVVNLIFQSDAIVLVEQMSVRTQTQYKQEWLADLFTADTIYGKKIVRESSVVPVITPNN
jgi:N4-gp56 family major capsid protein